MNIIATLLMLYLCGGIAWSIKVMKDANKYVVDNNVKLEEGLQTGMKLGASMDGVPRTLTNVFFPVVLVVGIALVVFGKLLSWVMNLKEWFRITFNSKQELEDFKKYTQMVCTDLVQFTSYGRIMTENDKNYLLGVIDVLNSKKEFIRKVEKKTKSEKKFDFDFMENTIRSTLKFHGWDA